jgi:hypothetical protein
MCGYQRATGAMLLVLRNGVKLVRLVRRTAGAAVLRRSVALAFGWHPSRFSRGLRASRFYGQVLRSADIKADGCDVFCRRPTYSGAKARKHWAFSPKLGVRSLMASRGAGGLASGAQLAGDGGES